MPTTKHTQGNINQGQRNAMVPNNSVEKFQVTYCGQLGMQNLELMSVGVLSTDTEHNLNGKKQGGRVAKGW